MVLDDEFIGVLDQNRFEKALGPKMDGAWNLHTATTGLDLEHFIGFSSISSVVGVPKQSNYNAGNFFLEALANHRRALGLPALTVNWGALLGAGFVERNRKTADFLEKIGTKAFRMDEALRVLGRMILQDSVQVAAARLDWRTLSRACPNLARSNTYAAVARESSDSDRSGSLLARLQAASADSRPGMVEDFIAAAVAGVFGVASDKVDRTAPLTSLGLDSLMAVELTNRIERELCTNIPMGSLLGGPSIQTLAQTILRLVAPAFQDDSSSSSTPACGHDNYETEVLLDPDITPVPNGKCDLEKFDRILLTGATGFLGAFLLDELLRETDAEIVCLVRARDEEQARERIARNLQQYGLRHPQFAKRVVAISGNLEESLLGLTASEFDRLSSDIDVIYHNGAAVNLIYPYSQLRAANVGGTREILRLATQSRPKPVHYVSTFMVLAAVNGHARSIVTEEDALPPWQDLPDGYSRSKWVAEMLIREARDRGLPVTVYRPGHITGHSRTGVCNPQDFLHTICLACANMGLAPDIDESMDVTPVDYVSRAIVQLSRRPECLGGTYHLVNPHPLRFPVLMDWMQRNGLEMETVSFPVWRQRLTTLANGASEDLIAPLLKLLGPNNGQSEDEQLRWHPRYDCRHAASRLAENGIVCPRADHELLGIYREHLQSNGLLLPALHWQNER
jgi:thioester reductase-like protein